MNEPDETGGTDPGRMLRVLNRRTPVTSGWRAPDTVRRRSVRRRRTRWTAGTAVVLTAAIATAVSLVGGSPHSQVTTPLGGVVRSISGPHGSTQLVANTTPVSTIDQSNLAAVVAAEQRLSLALLNQIGDGSNVTVSPASLYLALGMLQNGARGQTADQIATALQANGISTADQNAGLAALTNELRAAAAKDGIAFDSANSLWQQKDFEVKRQFLDALAAYYRTGIWQVDYAHHMDDALAALNAWASDKTHGKITRLFDSLDPATVLVLANAIYFHAAWQTPFDKDSTRAGTFTTSDGRQVRVKFMSGGPGLQGAITDDYQALGLPYTGGRFEALAVMPTHGSLPDFIASLTPGKINTIASDLNSGLSVSMPRFTTTSTIDLKPVLEALGMQQAFGDSADLSGLGDESTMVDQVIQRDYLGVGELGTTAAAVTGISIMPTSATPGPAIALDHPFLFLVRDTQTGAILFASEITDPSAG